MDLDNAVEAIWNAYQQGVHYPADWIGKLSLADGYQVQCGLRERIAATGAVHAGWKIGLTAPALRELFGCKTPVFGYLLEQNGNPSGHAFSAGEIAKPMLESELMLVLEQDLVGPGVTVEAAREAIGQVIPAFEIISDRGGNIATDLGLAVADNVMHAAYVSGAAIPFTKEMELGDARAVVKHNGAVQTEALCRDAMDQPVASIAWLANEVSKYGASLLAGHRILTGSFNKPFPLNAGDRVETHFSGVGTVNARFV